MNTFYDIAGNRLMAALLPVLLATRADASNEGVISGSLGVDSTDTLSVAGSLILVIAVILLAGFLYSRINVPHSGSKGVINIIASQGLGPKERVILLEIADTQLVVGLTASQVQTLHVFDTPVVQVTNSANKRNFADRLKAAVRGDRE